MTTWTANIVNLLDRRIFPGSVQVADGRIVAIQEHAGPCDGFLLPGFVDAHVHVESSMMVPSEFARIAVTHGTVATVSDPHEIANVLGVEGVRFMVTNGRRVPFKFHFGVPPCVPATGFETAGATLDAAAVETLFRDDGLRYLSEVMNYPGVLAGDADLLAKIASARRRGLPVDGHAPGLCGDQVRRYAAAGIATDHECVTLDEALGKIACGMAILIREGSAAKNFDALHPLLSSHPESCMFCSDDLHPDSLLHGHIDRLVRRAVAHDHDVIDVLRGACVRPVKHYGLPVGLLRVGDPADFIEVDNLTDFRVRQTVIDGRLVADHGESCIRHIEDDIEYNPPNVFRASRKHMDEFRTRAGSGLVRVIEASDGQLVTGESHRPPVVTNEVQKIAVVNRYADAPPAIGFVRGFGVRRGAIAASVAHDSHNIVAVGVEDSDLCAAVNAVIDARGGLAVVDGTALGVLPLEVAGLMGRNGEGVAAGYAKLDAMARGLGSPLTAPFMTLSFMALLVIPSLKLSDKGLFDGRAFQFVPLFV